MHYVGVDELDRHRSAAVSKRHFLEHKAELRVAAMRELGVSKNSFDFAWIDAIETTGRHDWYDPLRGKTRTRI